MGYTFCLHTTTMMIPQKTIGRVTVTNVTGRATRLSPCIVAIDGNEFYVYASMAIYERHDFHGTVRERIWNTFSLDIFGVKSDQLSQQQQPILENARQQECFIEWLRLVSPNPEETALGTDLYALSAVLIDTIRNNLMEQFSPPSLLLVCSLLSRCFGVGVVLYDADDNNGERWEPLRIWHPPTVGDVGEGKSKYIHLMRRGRILEMLLKPAHHSSPLRRSYPIPTRVVSALPTEMRQRALNTVWDSELIAKYGKYSLCAYNSETRKNLFIAHFVAPETKIHPSASTIHYLRIDARLNTNAMTFFVGGCDKQAEPVYIYASSIRNGVRIAILIAHWNVDYYCPHICLESTDDAIVVVPCSDARRAAQLVTIEYQCQLYDKRPISLVTIKK